MNEIRDFKCTYGNSVGIREEITEALPYEFPDAYCHRDSLAALSRAVKEYDRAAFCLLPFCRTTEAEALGASIRLGDAKTGPRAGEYICQSMDDLLHLPELDLQTPRLKETLAALSMLKQQGETTAYELTGPFTILNSLIDVKYIFKAYRKDYDALISVLKKLQDDLCLLSEKVQDAGADILILSDSAGAPSILGPRMTGKIMEDFTADFIKAVAETVRSQSILLLCPKFTYALLDTGHAEYRDHPVSTADFTQALLQMRGKARIAGQTCIKNIGVQMKEPVFHELILK